MPIFEYKCKKCDTKFEMLHKSQTNLQDVTCPNCKSTDNKKLLSSFSSTGFSSGSSSCESGNCGFEPLHSGGCSSGMCGLN